ncbi:MULTISPECIES: acyltransferase family protein [unclassified Nocardioides]|uniref:acyltransferase family protein n=1 Tax=unclassified Nocardioides TaxID=2615069 RepID=UPI000AB753BB|nr:MULTISPECIES: acyltransferase [unclassified Nocardioides]
MTTNQSSTLRIAELTSLRFVAAILVFAYHAEHLGLVGTSMFSWGYNGVSFFFILSGFVLTLSHRTERSNREFYFRRFARIFPVYFAVLVFAVVIEMLGILDPRPSVWQVVIHLFALQSWSPSDGMIFAVNGVDWSISTEFAFYAAFPLVFLVLHRQRPGVVKVVTIAWVAACALLYVGFAAFGFTAQAYVNPLIRSSEFIVGIFLALMILSWSDVRVRRPGRWLGIWMLAAIPLIAVASICPRAVANFVLLPVFAALIVLVAVARESPGLALLRTSWLIRLGEWSFAFYLVHQLVLRLAVEWVPDRGAAGVGAATASLACSILLAWALHAWLELPAQAALLRTFRRVQDRESRSAHVGA